MKVDAAEKIIRFNNTIIVTNDSEIINCADCQDLTGTAMELCAKHFLEINQGKRKVFPAYDIYQRD